MTSMNEPLVLLPGMMCDARLFLPQIAMFSPNRPIAVMPLHGKKAMAGLARQVLDAAPPRFSLAGLSMGGIVAMEVVRQAPERVTRLALLDTNPLADPQGSDRERILGLCMDMAEALGPKVFEEQSIALQHRPDQCEMLKSVTVPTLLLCGEDDRLCTVSHHELMCDLIPGAHLSVIPGAGHLPTLEQPMLTNRILEKWLKL
jgi:pimeloyl-ACP methyl ester carboxylesterase